jgi:hypothetical protein
MPVHLQILEHIENSTLWASLSVALNLTTYSIVSSILLIFPIFLRGVCKGNFTVPLNSSVLPTM